MFFARQPTQASILQLLDDCRGTPVTHAHVGATRTEPPAGFTVDRYGVDLGHGPETFDRAKAAVRQFAMYPPSWCSIVRRQQDLAQGTVFAAVIRHLGFWSVNPCRIVYMLDETEPIARRGFAIGTLPGHAESGEELFSVTMAPGTSLVRYEVLAFSRPQALLARLGAPYSRMLQRRFAADSCAAMQAAVRDVVQTPNVEVNL